jgi:predicted  nucleic acid-binding Zn-ribbon protein
VILWLLRQFAAFRDLEAELRSAAERRIALEDQVRHLTHSLEKATERADKAQRELIDALKDQSKQPQAIATDVNVRPFGRQGRAVVAEQTAKFYIDAQKQFEEMLARSEN